MGGWPGYAEADPTLVGILVASVSVLAIGYAAYRLGRRRREGP